MAPDAPERKLGRMPERRFICSRCRTKWFVPPDHPVDEVPDCGACGGSLVPLVSRPYSERGEGTTSAVSAPE
jgi:hypothetical protein